MYDSKAVFHQNFVQAGTHKTIFHFPRHTFVNVYRPAKRRHLVTHRDLFQYCKLADKFPAIFRVVFGILRGVLKFLRIYFTISRRTLKDNPPNNRWETLVSIDDYSPNSKEKIYTLLTTKKPIFLSDYNTINFIVTFP
jgi:hypothetical protein